MRIILFFAQKRVVSKSVPICAQLRTMGARVDSSDIAVPTAILSLNIWHLLLKIHLCYHIAAMH